MLNNKKIYLEIIRLAQKEQFEEAYKNFHDSKGDICDFWEFVIHNVEKQITPINLYLFLQYLYIRTRNIDLLLYMSEQLIYVMPFSDDPYMLAFYNISEAIRKEPNKIVYKEFLIDSFYDYPERYLTKEKYIEIAKEVLKNNPHHQKSLEVIMENS